jgi:hypothetical protein
MAANEFSIAESLRFGFGILKNNLRFFAVLMLVTIAIYGALIFKGWLLLAAPPITAALLYVLIFGALIYLEMGFIKITLKLVAHEEAKITDLFTFYPILPKYFVGTLAYAAIVLAGFLFFLLAGTYWLIEGWVWAGHIYIIYLGLALLLLPCIYLAVIFCFYAYFILDRGLSPLNAFIQSARASRGIRFRLAVFLLLALAINIVGLLPLGAGLIVTVPLCMSALAHIYAKATSCYQALT